MWQQTSHTQLLLFLLQGGHNLILEKQLCLLRDIFWLEYNNFFNQIIFVVFHFLCHVRVKLYGSWFLVCLSFRLASSALFDSSAGRADNCRLDPALSKLVLDFSNILYITYCMLPWKWHRLLVGGKKTYKIKVDRVVKWRVSKISDQKACVRWRCLHSWGNWKRPLVSCLVILHLWQQWRLHNVVVIALPMVKLWK